MQSVCASPDVLPHQEVRQIWKLTPIVPKRKGHVWIGRMVNRLTQTTDKDKTTTEYDTFGMYEYVEQCLNKIPEDVWNNN